MLSTFTSKIALSVLASGIALGSGALFSGTDELDNASSFVLDVEERLIQYEKNEEAFKVEIQLIKNEANNKIAIANNAISDLEKQILNLNAENAELKSGTTVLIDNTPEDVVNDSNPSNSEVIEEAESNTIEETEDNSEIIEVIEDSVVEEVVSDSE